MKLLIAILNWARSRGTRRGRCSLTPIPSGPEDAHGKEPDPRGCHPGGVRGIAQGVGVDGLAVPRGAGDRARGGHRIGAIRQLRWSDIDMESRIIRWRAENEKTGYEHRTPVTTEVLAAWRRRGCRPQGRELSRDARAEGPPRGAWTGRGCASGGTRPRNLQGEPKRGRGWHSLRRKFASDLMGSTAQGALPARWLEDGPDSAPVLPEGRRGPAQEGP